MWASQPVLGMAWLVSSARTTAHVETFLKLQLLRLQVPSPPHLVYRTALSQQVPIKFPSNRRTSEHLSGSDNVLEKNICKAARLRPINLVDTCGLPIPVFLS